VVDVFILFGSAFGVVVAVFDSRSTSSITPPFFPVQHQARSFRTRSKQGRKLLLQCCQVEGIRSENDSLEILVATLHESRSTEQRRRILGAAVAFIGLSLVQKIVIVSIVTKGSGIQVKAIAVKLGAVDVDKRHVVVVWFR
jgi:hypothetical protein